MLAGELLIAAARDGGAQHHPDRQRTQRDLPVPADRAAQPAPVLRPAGVRRIVLTASGGPFRGRARADLARSRPRRRSRIPKWSMGPKISVDSATLMNKGLEVIEAHHLFGLPGERIEVLVHPQSLVHSLVEFVDGSTLAQLGLPDMRTALAVGLAWPERIASGVDGLDLLAHGRLEFEPPDLDAFPCLRLAYDALAAGGTAPAVLNAANEVAVSAFLQGKTGFLAIPALVEDCAGGAAAAQPATSLDALRDADARARRFVEQSLSRHSRMQPHEPHSMSDVFRFDVVDDRQPRAAGDLPRVRPLLGGAPLRRQGAAFLGRLRQAAVVAPRHATAPNTSSPRSRSAATSRCSTSARARSRRPNLPQAFNRKSVWQRIAIVAAGPIGQPAAVRGAAVGDVRDRPARLSRRCSATSRASPRRPVCSEATPCSRSAIARRRPGARPRWP